MSRQPSAPDETVEHPGLGRPAGTGGNQRGSISLNGPRRPLPRVLS